MLVAHTISPQQTDFGCGNWVNLRPEVGSDEIGLLIGFISIVVDKLGERATVDDLDKMTWRSFRDKIKEKEYLREIKAMGEKKRVSQLGSAQFNVSNVGYVDSHSERCKVQENQ
jgi:hypothetical protein